MADERPPRYTEGKGANMRTIYRASGLGGCPRTFVLYAQRHRPAPHPEWFQQVLDEGTASESMIDHMWEVRTGVPSVDSGENQREYDLEVLPGVFVRCHPDGAAGTAGAIREYKKIREGVDGKQWEAFKRRGVELHTHWLWQAAIEMHATGRALEFVGGRWRWNDPTDESKGGKIVEVYGHELVDPPLPLKAIRLRVAQLEKLLSKPIKAADVECNPRQFPCPYYASGMCGGADGDGATKAKGATDWTKDADADVLRALVAKWDVAAAQATDLEREAKLVRADKAAALEGITGWMAAKGIGATEIGAFLIDGKGFEITHTAEAEVPAHTRKGYSQMKRIKLKDGAKGGAK